MSEYDIILETFRGKIGFCFNYKDLEEVESLVKEIERLNNIIKEYDNWLDEQIDINEDSNNQDYLSAIYSISYCKLQEIKELNCTKESQNDAIKNNDDANEGEH